MDKIEAKNRAKDKIDDIFNKLEELERTANEIAEEHRAKLNKDMSEMKNSRDTLKELYESLESASKESLRHIQSAFDQMSAVMSKRIEKISKTYRNAVEV